MAGGADARASDWFSTVVVQADTVSPLTAVAPTIKSCRRDIDFFISDKVTVALTIRRLIHRLQGKW